MEGKKRKREPDYPRVIYHASNRTFDRLFKESSLEETREVVRRKLGLPADAEIQLAQLRQHITVDLDDEEDFEAFYALAHLTMEVNVRVTVTGDHDQSIGACDPPESALQKHPAPTTPKKKSRKCSSRDFPLPGTPSTSSMIPASNNLDKGPSESSPSISATSKKRKVTFSAFSQLDAAGGTPASEEPSAKKTKGNSGVVRKKRTSDGKTQAIQGGRSSVSGFDVGDDPTAPGAKRSKTVSCRPDSALLSSDKGKFRESGNAIERPALVDDSVPTETSKKKSKEAVVLPDTHPLFGLPAVFWPSRSPEAEERATTLGKSTTKKTMKKSGLGQPYSGTFPEQLAGVIAQNADVVRKHLSHSAAGDGTGVVGSSDGPQGGKTKTNQGHTVEGELNISSSRATPTDAVPKHRRKNGKKKQAEQRNDEDINMDVHEAPSETPASIDDYVQELIASKIAARRAGITNPSSVDANVGEPKEPKTQLETHPSGKRARKSTLKSLVPSDLPEKSDDRPSGHVENPPVKPMSSPSPVPAKSEKVQENSKHKLVSAQVPCPVCLATPFHLRYRCPVIRSGPDAIKRRLGELKNDESRNRERLIEELEELIGNSEEKQNSINVNSMPTPLTGLASTSTHGGKLLADNAAEIPDPPGHGILSASEGLDSPRPSMNSVIPSGSHVSEVIIEGQDEGSTDYSSEDDINDVDDRSPVVQPVPPFPTYDDDLEAIIRGPTGSRSVLLDIPSRSVTDEEEACDDVVLAEDDDMGFYGRARRLERADSSEARETELDTVGDETKSDGKLSPIHTPSNEVQSKNRKTAFVHSPSSSPVALQVVDASGESLPTDDAGDRAFSQALAEDTAIFKLAEELPVHSSTTDSDADTRVEHSASNDGEINISPLQPWMLSNSEKGTVLLVSSDAARDEVGSNFGIVPAGLDLTSAPMEGRKVTRAQIAKLLAPFQSPAVGTVGGGMASRNHDYTEQREDDQDSIQPADDLREHTPEPSPIEGDQWDGDQIPIDLQSTPKSTIIARMRNRSGQTPLSKSRSPLQESDSHFTFSPAKKLSRPRESTGAIATDQLEDGSVTKGSKAAHAASEAVETPPPPIANIPARRRRGRPPKSETQKAQEAAAKLAAKEEKARLRKEKADAKADSKKGKGTPSAKVASISAKPMLSPPREAVLLQTPEMPNASLVSEIQSLDQWSTLQDPEISIMTDQFGSSGVDELVSEGDRTNACHPEIEGPNEENAKGSSPSAKSPLFILTESQLPFPYSQWENDPPDVQGKEASEGEPKLADEEWKTEKPVAPPPRAEIAPGSYRKLTDIASQQALFSTQQIMGPPSFHTSPMTSRKWDNMYTGTEEDEEDEDEEDEDDSGTDSGAERKSHIPKSRRAGAGVQPKKGRGLLSFLY